MNTTQVIQNDETITNSKKTQYKWDIAWGNVIALAILHVAAIYGLAIKPYSKWQALYLAKLIAFMSNVAVIAGAHRLWAHRTYKANNFLQIVLACWMCLTYQNSIYTWCRDHRLHHKHSETDADPHNAKRGFFFSHMGWLMLRKHPEVKEKGKSLDMSDLKANPIVMFQHRYYYFLVFFFGGFLSTYVHMYLFGESFKIAFFSLTIYRYVVTVNLTWCINSLAHLYGNKPYDKNIGPTENLFMKYIAFGEGFHNYHHTFPYDYKASEFGDDARNVTTLIIDMFASFGWVTDRQMASSELVKKKVKRSGDGTHDQTLLPKNSNKSLDNLKHIIVIIVYLIII